MDRLISLLAALVGLIALGGAILVHNNADTQRRELAGDIAQLKASVSLLGHEPAASIPPIPVAASEEPSSSAPAASSSSAEPPVVAAAQPADDETARTLQAMQDRIASLEQQTRDQASALSDAQSRLATAQSQLASQPSSAPDTQVATAAPTPLAPPTASSASAPPPAAASGATPAAITADGPTKDCIPIGTRFMGAAGDSFPICKTRQVVKVAAVTDGLATVTGPGDITAGATVALSQGCTITVFSADNSGYAEMRVSCQ